MKPASRIKHITQANINAFLDKMEKPEKMISMMIQEMEDAIIDLKTSVAARAEAKHQAEIERKLITQKISRWEERAVTAVKSNRDDLAKEALVEKKRYEKNLEILMNDISQYEKLNTQGQTSITELEEKIELVRQRQRLLLQRGIHAVEKKKANEILRNAESNEAYRRFLELEAKIEKIEAEAEVAGFSAPAESEDSFIKMETDNAVEQELTLLKKNLQKESTDKE
jgi:phage shock protein A